MRINSKINIGYPCVNTQLLNPEKFGSDYPKVVTNRSMKKATFLKKGIVYASELSLKNCKDLFKIIKWNYNNDFNFFRVTSDLFPWCSDYQLSDLPDYLEIHAILTSVGKYVDKNKMRITSHPGPFNVLTSPKENVVENCINDLSTHGELFDIMNLKKTPYNKINIHIGGVYGDKELAMKRFCKNFLRLPENVKSRLTVENDDKITMYSVSDLYKGVYKIIGIPIVFDYHHHRFCNGGLSEEKALELAVSTWKNITPVVHYSESRNIEQKDDRIKPQAHSDYVNKFINSYNQKIDIMIEAKAKELAVLNYIKKWKHKY